MANSEYSASDLVAMSADYFAANPDVEHLVAVVGTGSFYRPERESIAKDEARVASSTTMRIQRSHLAAADKMAALAEVPEYPAVVGVVELLLASVKLIGATARQLAEIIYGAALQEGMSAASAEDIMEAVADFLGTKMAEGLDAITYTAPEPVFTAVIDNSGAQIDTLASLADQGLVNMVADEPTADAAPADADTSAADTSADADASTPAATPAKAKAAPKKKASTVANAA